MDLEETGSHCVPEAGLELRYHPASAARLLGLQRVPLCLSRTWSKSYNDLPAFYFLVIFTSPLKMWMPYKVSTPGSAFVGCFYLERAFPAKQQAPDRLYLVFFTLWTKKKSSLLWKNYCWARYIIYSWREVCPSGESASQLRSSLQREPLTAPSLFQADDSDSVHPVFHWNAHIYLHAEARLHHCGVFYWRDPWVSKCQVTHCFHDSEGVFKGPPEILLVF